jgi:type IV pilus assembly protein PilV
MDLTKNNDGFTLIEVLIAMVVFSIGILGVMTMQIQAIKGNTDASRRSQASTVALSVIEELKRLPFDDVTLTAGANLNAGIAVAGGAPTPGNADHRYLPAQLPLLSNIYQVNGTNLVDSSGTSYQIFWNVDKTPVVIGTDSFLPFCTIRLFMYWDTPLGTNRLEITTYKYNNITL